MKRLFSILALIIVLTGSSLAADMPQVVPPVGGNMAAQSFAVPKQITCDSYVTCMEQYAELSAEERKSYTLLYYNNSNTEYKFSIFGNYILKIGAKSCPPVVDIYRKINNMNLALELFSIAETGECSTFYGNINGDGMNRDVIIGQIEVKFCDKDYSVRQCEQGVILGKLNLFK